MTHMTYEEWKVARKGVKHYMSAPGWALLIYYFILNASVLGLMVVEVTGKLLRGIIAGDYVSIEMALTQAFESAWGYLFAIAIGFVMLLIWKKPRFFKYEIFAKGAAMKAGAFFSILCVFIGGQLVFQIGTSLLELSLNLFGFTIMEGLATLQAEPNNLSMFLYAGILGPVAEEILFRGLVQRTMLPFGKKFAILVSALTFALFHGNLLQTPYAFCVGLVLGYVAAEYHILWAILLHVINNLVLGDLIYRVLSPLGDDMAYLIVWGVIFAFSVAGVVVLIAKRKQISDWLRKEQLIIPYVGCYFTCAGTIAMMIVLGISTLITTFEMITPL